MELRILAYAHHVQTDPGRLSPKPMFVVFYFRLVTVLDDRDKAQIFFKGHRLGLSDMN